MSLAQQSCLPFIASKRERFNRFHAEHPEVYREFIRLARLAKAKGFKRFGARAIWGRMRWNYALEKDPNETYKLNDHYIAYYARLAMEQEPDLRGFFETRKTKEQ